jgi:hypothetical protein
MKKLTLDLAALRVETFVAGVELAPRAGTVRANAASGAETCKVTYCQETCLCPNTSPQPSCDECSWNDCSGESCQVTNCLTCLCPNTSPRPSCDPCSWMDCFSGEVACA